MSCKGDNLHEMSKPIFWEIKRKNISHVSHAEFVQSVVGFKHGQCK